MNVFVAKVFDNARLSMSLLKIPRIYPEVVKNTDSFLYSDRLSHGPATLSMGC